MTYKYYMLRAPAPTCIFPHSKARLEVTPFLLLEDFKFDISLGQGYT